MFAKIHGNTFPVRVELAALGGRWDYRAQCWLVPVEHEAKARALVEMAVNPPSSRFTRRPEPESELTEETDRTLDEAGRAIEASRATIARARALRERS
jgi:hypothetical protein